MVKTVIEFVFIGTVKNGESLIGQQIAQGIQRKSFLWEVQKLKYQMEYNFFLALLMLLQQGNF